MNKLIFFLFFIMFGFLNKVESEPYPIQFGIPEVKFVQAIPEKDQDFAFIIPGNYETYIFSEEESYYKDYRRSYFALTKKKGGWDCMRHYEILANGCIPYFEDLDNCDLNTMTFLPRDLIKEAMNLEGVSYLKIDHTKFNKTKYFEILNKLLEHAKSFITTRHMGNYLLNKMGYSGSGKILFLSKDLDPDYMRCCTLIGLKEVLGDKIIDFPKINHIYKSYPAENTKNIYGKGFSYTRILEDLPIDREDIAERIKNKEFELIIYGSIHRGLLFYDLVTETYDSSKICYICGEDYHQCPYSQYKNLFLREFEAYIH